MASGDHEVERSLKDLVLQAGLEVLTRDGVDLVSDSINYANVFGYLQSEYEIRVTRGSVHERIWTNHDDFRREVLAEAVKSFPAVASARGIGARSATPSVLAALRVSSDPPNDLSRHLGFRLWNETLASSEYRSFQATKAIALRYNDEVAENILHGAFKQRAEERLSERQAGFPSLLSAVGLRLNESLGLAQADASDLFHILVGSLLVGGQLNHRAGFETLNNPIDFLSIPDDADEPWTIATIGIKAALDLVAEVDPGGGRAAEPPSIASRSSDDAGSPPMTHEELFGSGRRSRQQLKRLVLTAGVELLRRDGLDLRPKSLSYSAVLSHVEAQQGIVVNRSAVSNRLWPSHADFCMEVLAAEVASDPDPKSLMLQSFNSTSISRSASGPVEHRQTALLLFRSFVESQLEVLSSSASFKRRLLIKAALPDLPDGQAKRDLQAAIRTTENRAVTSANEIVQERILGLGFTPHPELGLSEEDGLQILGQLSLAIATGVLFDQLSGSQTVSRSFTLPSIDGSGQIEQWTPASIAVRAFFELLYVWTE